MSDAAAWVSAISTAFAAIGTIAAALVAYVQLRKLNRTLRLNTLSLALDLEKEINVRKERVDEQVAFISENRAKGASEEEIKPLLDELDGYMENWLNVVDRLAYCIRKSYIPEEEWIAEYRNYFRDLINDHESWFRNDSPYLNILYLHRRWQDR